MGDLQAPSSGVSAKVSIIDTGMRLTGWPIAQIAGPPVKGFELIPPLPSLSFLIESPSGKKAIFDLSVPKSWDQFSPESLSMVRGGTFTIHNAKDVASVLRDHSFPLESVNSIIWSHSHWDHLGDPSTFPPTTELVVGPGFVDTYLPAYPENPNSRIRESDIANRYLREVSFDDGLVICGYNAKDFFGDGSFYLLDCPGHDIGHLTGLVRTTTAPDTFIYLGADIAHHGGLLKPTQYLQVPESVHFDPTHVSDKLLHCVCPGAVFNDLQTRRGRSTDQPFFELTWAHNLKDANESIHKVMVAEAHDNMLVIIAHDDTLSGVVDFFPLPANNWKQKGWADKIRWAFLKDFLPAVNSSSKGQTPAKQ